MGISPLTVGTEETPAQALWRLQQGARAPRAQSESSKPYHGEREIDSVVRGVHECFYMLGGEYMKAFIHALDRV